MTLLVIVTLATVAHGLVPFWFLGVKTMAEPLVAADPTVVKDVAVDGHVLAVLELKEILDVPVGPGGSGCLGRRRPDRTGSRIARLAN